MTSVAQAVLRFLREEDGPTAVEYAFMLALILMVCILAIQNIGTKTSDMFGSLIAYSGFNGT